MIRDRLGADLLVAARTVNRDLAAARAEIAKAPDFIRHGAERAFAGEFRKAERHAELFAEAAAAVTELAGQAEDATGAVLTERARRLRLEATLVELTAAIRDVTPHALGVTGLIARRHAEDLLTELEAHR